MRFYLEEIYVSKVAGVCVEGVYFIIPLVYPVRWCLVPFRKLFDGP